MYCYLLIRITSVKGKSESKSKVVVYLFYNDTENVQIDTEKRGNDTDDIKNDTESLSAKIYDAANDAVKSRLKKELLEIIKKNGLTLPQLMKNYSIRRATAQRDMKILRSVGLVSFVGAPKTGKYMITEKFEPILNKL